MHLSLLISTVLLFDLPILVPQHFGSFGIRSSKAPKTYHISQVDEQLPAVVNEPLFMLIGESESPMVHSRSKKQARYINTWIGQGASLRPIEERVFVSGRKAPFLKIFHHQNGLMNEISLKDSIENKLIEYLSYGPPKRRFDCGDFVTYLLEMKRSIYRAPLLSPRLRKVTDASSVPPGEVVFVSSSAAPRKDDITHFALSLGEGLYLSKFGKGGKLRVTNLEQMKHFYSGRAVYRHLPSSELRALGPLRS